MGSAPVRVPESLLRDVDAMVAEGYRGAGDRTDILRDALVPFIASWRAEKAQAERGVA